MRNPSPSSPRAAAQTVPNVNCVGRGQGVSCFSNAMCFYRRRMGMLRRRDWYPVLGLLSQVRVDLAPLHPGQQSAGQSQQYDANQQHDLRFCSPFWQQDLVAPGWRQSDLRWRALWSCIRCHGFHCSRGHAHQSRHSFLLQWLRSWGQWQRRHWCLLPRGLRRTRCPISILQAD